MADNKMLQFKMGQWSEGFDTLEKKAGTVYVTTNEKAMYVDISDSERIRINDIIQVESARTAKPPFSTNAFYYFIEENALLRWNGSEWKQLNNVADIKASVDALIARMKTAEDDIDAVEKAVEKAQGDVDALKAKVGEVPEGSDTVVAYIDKKTAGIASDEALTALGERVSTVEGKATTLEGQTAQLDTDVKAAQKAADDEAVRAKAVEKEIKDSIGTVTESKTVVEMIADAKQEAITAATYDDTALKASVSQNTTNITAVMADYLKAADKTELTAAITAAKEEAIATIMGEAGIDEKYDTLKEIADWILADTTNSAALVTKVDDIYKDYLKGADKTELEGKITEVKTLVGTIPQDATSTTVVDYVKEVVDALNIGDYAKAADLTALAGRVATVEATCNGLGVLATKDQISEAEVEATLLAKINQAHTHANADVLAGITAALVEQWNDAYKQAHKHENAAELAKIADGDKAKWDAMEQNAKDYVDGKLVWGTF